MRPTNRKTWAFWRKAWRTWFITSRWRENSACRWLWRSIISARIRPQKWNWSGGRRSQRAPKTPYFLPHWEKGGEGAADLARAVMAAAEKPAQFRFLYPLELSIKEKIETICREVYGADGVDYLPLAEERIQRYAQLGYDRLPVCMAKTHLSPKPRSKPERRTERFPVCLSGISAPRSERVSSTLCWGQ